MMRKRRKLTPALFLLVLLVLTGCAGQTMAEEEKSSMTWEQAKATAQAMEQRIAGLVPSGDLLSIDQHAKGSLFNCDEKQHRWKGITYVTLVPGVDVEAIAKQIEAQLRADGSFEVTNYLDIAGVYVVAVQSPATGEGYLFGEGDPGTILIDSWSECFTLPEGTYPGGSF